MSSRRAYRLFTGTCYRIQVSRSAQIICYERGPGVCPLWRYRATAGWRAVVDGEADLDTQAAFGPGVPALLFHGNFADRNQLLHFEKDFAIAGGLLVLFAFGPGRYAIGGSTVRG